MVVSFPSWTFPSFPSCTFQLLFFNIFFVHAVQNRCVRPSLQFSMSSFTPSSIREVAAVTLSKKMKEEISKEKGTLVEGDNDSLQLHHFWAVQLHNFDTAPPINT
jgi:hypothetical protein